MTTIESLPNDLYRKLALDLSPLDIERLCLVSKRFKHVICDSHDFWRLKIRKDFPLRGKYLPNILQNMYQNNPRELYQRIQQKAKMFTIEDARDILRGDIIDLKRLKNIWDGEKEITIWGDADFDADVPHIVIPQSMRFPEFPIDHFSEASYSDYRIYLSPDKIQELIDNFDEYTQISVITDKYNTYKLKIHAPVYDDDAQGANARDFDYYLHLTKEMLRNIFITAEKSYILYNEEDEDDDGSVIHLITLDVETKNE